MPFEDRRHEMKTLFILFSALMLSQGAFAKPNIPKINPANALNEALEVAQQRLKRLMIEQRIENGVLYSMSAERGKFADNDFSDYSFNFKVSHLTGVAQCRVFVTIRKVPFAKQLHIVLEEVPNDYQIIAQRTQALCF